MRQATEDRRSGGVRRDGGDPLRILFYSHDTYGLGHLRRTLTLARFLRADRPLLTQLIVTGSPPPPPLPPPPRPGPPQLPPGREGRARGDGPPHPRGPVAHRPRLAPEVPPP